MQHNLLIIHGILDTDDEFNLTGASEAHQVLSAFPLTQQMMS